MWLLAASLPAARSRAASEPTNAATEASFARHSQDAADDDGAVVRSGRALHFPRDHGAHRLARIEWWYATGWLGAPQAPTHGFQVTFFRSATGLAAHVNSRFAARHLVLAHGAVTHLGTSASAGQHLHEQHIARWSGDPAAPGAGSQLLDADVRLGRWWLRRQGAAWHASIQARSFSLELQLSPTQPLLLQGEQGFSRKGPDTRQASHYYSEPQLAASVQLGLQSHNAETSAQPGSQKGSYPGSRQSGRESPVSLQGRAWLDHEWSNELLHPEAVGWDWLGINLFDGGALTAFVLRRADGSVLWAGGSYRPAGGAVRAFSPHDVRWQALRLWASPATAARYPVHVRLRCPAGQFEVRALLDAQELAGGGGTGASAGGNIYWEGLSELTAPGGQRLGLGYLEMTGYAAPLRLG